MRGSKLLRIFLAIILLICLFLAAGCWDLRELQDRGFVMAVGIDDADAARKDAKSKEKARVETFVQNQGEKIYRLSFQVLKLTPASAQGERGPDPTKTFVYSNTGNSVFELLRDTLGQSSKPLYFEHLQAIIISEAAVKKYGLTGILDLFRRDAEMRWHIKTLLTSGEAKPLLEFNPPTGEPGGRYFVGIVNNHKKNTHVPGARTDLGNLSQALVNGYDVIIPRIEMQDKVVKVGGAALFKKDQFVGYVDEYVVRGMKFISGTEKSAIIPVECPDHPGQMLVFELFNHDTRLTSHVEGDRIYFTLEIVMRGNLGEVQCQDKHDTHSTQYLHDAEQLFAEEVKRNALFTMETLQAMGVDPMRLRGLLKGQHPKEWEKIKDRWDEIYPTVPLIVSVNVNIRQLGEIRY